MCKTVFVRCLTVFAALAIVVMGSTQADAASKKKTVAIGMTSNLTGANPYSDSAAHMYSIWCNIYGCLVTYDFDKGKFVGMLAESWEVSKSNPNEWTFHLRKDIKSHDGYPLTAADVVHTVNRINTDPKSSQKQNVRLVKSIHAVDKHTVKIITKKPTAPLLMFISDLWAISQKRLFDKHGARTADRKYPFGFGPYKLKDYVIGDHVVMEKNENYPGISKDNPDIIIFRKMQEAEQRITALLNGELQIGQFIPPHLVSRVSKHAGTKIVDTDSVEIMMLLMNPAMKPWDNVLVRKAVCHAIDRDTLIDALLKGNAKRLDGPIGPGQYGYDPKSSKAMHIPYDPEKAAQLVKQAGYPNGVDVDLYTPVGRYVNDKQISEAIVPMLRKVGIRAKLHTPEWSTQWANVRKGKRPFFYQGRGSVTDPSPAISQYFQTGVSPRIKYSNLKVDAMLDAERAEFDPEKRKKKMNAAFKMIVDDAPACFMWRHKLVYGMANNVHYTPQANGRVYGLKIRVTGK